jgi:hypothetical protein
MGILFRENELPILAKRLLDISRCLKRRGSSESGFKETGVWLVDGGDNDAIIYEFTEESLARIRSGTPR